MDTKKRTKVSVSVLIGRPLGSRRPFEMPRMAVDPIVVMRSCAERPDATEELTRINMGVNLDNIGVNLDDNERRYRHIRSATPLVIED